MAMTQSVLLSLGAFATGLGYLGLFKTFGGGDRWTRVLLLFASAIVWGLFAMSSYDVIVRETSFASASEPILPLVYLGFGLAFIVALFGVSELLKAMAADASDATDGILS
jgi:hypothetical protein